MVSGLNSIGLNFMYYTEDPKISEARIKFGNSSWEGFNKKELTMCDKSEPVNQATDQVSTSDEDDMHRSYMRIREMLRAWDTNHGGQNRFEVTERRLAEVIAQRDEYLRRLQSIANIAHERIY